MTQVNCLRTLPGKLLTGICFVLLASFLSAQTPRQNPSYSPPEGMVPNGETAVKIAEAVLTPIYGKEVVEHERPFRVELVKGVWIVDGAIHPGPGGNLHIEISKKDGRIARVIGTE
jgi:hypothetical protein